MPEMPSHEHEGGDSPAGGNARRARVRVELSEDKGASLVRGGDSRQQDDEHDRPNDVPHGRGAVPYGKEARGHEIDDCVQEQNDCRAQATRQSACTPGPNKVCDWARTYDPAPASQNTPASLACAL